MAIKWVNESMEIVRFISLLLFLDHGAQRLWEEARRVHMFNNGQLSELINNVVAQQCREFQATQSARDDGQVKRGHGSSDAASVKSSSRVDKSSVQLLQGRRPQAQFCDAVSSEHPPQLKAKLFAKCLSGTPSCSAPGPGGCIKGMLRVCWDDAEVLQLRLLAVENFAWDFVQKKITKLFMEVPMTALRKRWCSRNCHRNVFQATCRTHIGP